MHIGQFKEFPLQSENKTRARGEFISNALWFSIFFLGKTKIARLCLLRNLNFHFYKIILLNQIIDWKITLIMSNLLLNLIHREILDLTEYHFIKNLKFILNINQILYTIIFCDLDLAHVLLMKIYSLSSVKSLQQRQWLIPSAWIIILPLLLVARWLYHQNWWHNDYLTKIEYFKHLEKAAEVISSFICSDY